MNKLSDIIILIGRNKFYPLFCILCVTLVFLYTDPFTQFDIRYTVSYIGSFCGLVCVILLAKRKNMGNVLGMFAGVAECSANILGGNIGAGLPSIYYFCSHIYGLLTWKKNMDNDKNVKVRSLSETSFLYTLIFLIVAAFINIYLTDKIGAPNTTYQLVINCFIFGLGMVAQLLLMMRYSFNWYLWVILNVLVIVLNIYTNNIIITTQYLIYLFNAIYGICEWKRSAQKE
ncbi:MULTISPECIES: nicotinamide riboside transporter PnuC [unclassified Gilliamella]|uniref:nicotinamide riboside transporter PnuC n=1 Tax=unclassified Gilliamella TaxID=2685620 RepID=UPI0013213F72|nr:MULTISPECIES: nicotinamide riboside transporter PnuC [unclassified Gilliamella]MWN31359.1 hypothetical protein [Gilliamella sp. Pra-s60]MWP29033.1 hypothetical protein [Gilliamella sp. Pra-s54]MWP47417.1 hypothetical protein [Gilliamella sp. Pas-s27]